VIDMAHFLLVYDRRQGRLLREERFDDASAALDERFRAEKAHRGDQDIEVVVLGADTSADLRRTHARYFMSLGDLVRTFGDGADRAADAS
jgi:hypothetical protein